MSNNNNAIRTRHASRSNRFNPASRRKVDSSQRKAVTQ